MNLRPGERVRRSGSENPLPLDMSPKMVESILDNLSEPILVLDGSLRGVKANPVFYRTFGISPIHVEGKFIQEFIVQKKNDQQSLATVLEGLAASDVHVTQFEVECNVPPSRRIVLSVAARHITDSDDFTEMVLVEFRDITQQVETDRRIWELNNTLRQHSAELEEINKELETFTHSVSHDLRTPLRLMNKIAHLLIHDYQDQLPAGARTRIGMILSSTEEIDHLVQHLLAFSSVKREPMTKRKVDLQRLAGEVVHDLRDQYIGRDVKVVIDELPRCRADRALMKLVFVNLLSNALKFTRPCDHAEIRIGYSEFEGKTIYFVRDNGIGFDMDKSEKMFVAFNRLHTALDFEGSGIGLALVKRIIDRHGGRIWAEGRTGRGATISFTLGE